MEPEHETVNAEETGQKENPSYEPYSRSTRLKAWIGIIFMVILVLGYTYSLATGKIMLW